MPAKDGIELNGGSAARSAKWLLAGLIAYCAFLFFFRLGSRSISDADEVRDALTAHTMVAAGDWWTPHFDGRPAFSKPPLFFWLTGALIKALGPSRWSIRLLPALSGMACVGALVALGRRLYGPAAGLWAGFIAATTIPFVYEHGARTGVMDSFLLALLACGFLFLVWSLENPRWLLVAAAVMGLASLTKNLTGLLAAAAGTAFLLRGARWRIYGPGRIAAAAAILLVLSFGWIAVMEATHSLEFRRIFFGKELVQRAFQPEKFTRRRSVPFLPGVFAFGQTAFRGFIPWSFLVPLAGVMALGRSRIERERDRLPALWLAVFGLTVLAVQVRFPWYAFLVDLPLALLVGRALAESFADASPPVFCFSFRTADTIRSRRTPSCPPSGRCSGLPGRRSPWRRRARPSRRSPSCFAGGPGRPGLRRQPRSFWPPRPSRPFRSVSPDSNRTSIASSPFSRRGEGVLRGASSSGAPRTRPFSSIIPSIGVSWSPGARLSAKFEAPGSSGKAWRILPFSSGSFRHRRLRSWKAGRASASSRGRIWTAWTTFRSPGGPPERLRGGAPVNPWIAIGLAGQVLFSLRFLVQWISSERRGESHIPVIFWYFSLGGGVVLLAYAIHRRDIVFEIGQAGGLVVYLRNLVLIRRRRAAGGGPKPNP
jgi:lipid-A-disaccharide synthase-like uncharacterized protein